MSLARGAAEASAGDAAGAQRGNESKRGRKERGKGGNRNRNRNQGKGGHDQKLSRALSRVLRHKALELGVAMRPDGFVKVAELQAKVGGLARYSMDDFHGVVAENDKKRFSLRQEAGDEWWVRANQGHSIALVREEQLLDEVDWADVAVCVHGTNLKAWAQIQTKGLSRMGRNHIHFAKGLPGADGVISGMRKSCQVLLYIDTAKAKAAGVKCFESSNGVLLSPGDDSGLMGPHLFAKAVHGTTGQDLLPLTVTAAAAPASAPVAAAAAATDTPAPAAAAPVPAPASTATTT